MARYTFTRPILGRPRRSRNTIEKTPSLAAIEANVEKADTLQQQTDGADDVQMQGYHDRSKYREVVGTKYAREVLLK